MTDIYVSYAREDRESVRKLGELLRLEGWDVWMDSSDQQTTNSAELDVKLAAASAILVVWSGYSRGSETVRSEAATGLYKNKLVQVKADTASPPRPFDQVEVIDLSRWSGDREDLGLRKIVSALRLLAGLPQTVRAPRRQPPPERVARVEPQYQPVERLQPYERPQRAERPERVERPSPALERILPPPRELPFDRSLDFDPMPHVQRLNTQSPLRDGPPRPYRETRRGGFLAPLFALGVLAAAGAAVWYVDPFAWRSPEGGEAASPEATQVATLENAAVTTAGEAIVEDTEESNANWTRVNRDSTTALRDYVSDYPRSSNSETARSLLRVRDAQAWVKAVTADNDGAYRAYLAEFPASGASPGAMAAAATERLTSLSSERSLAIRDIQSGLTALSLYDGMIDGQGGDETVRAVKQFASQGRKSAPALSTAAPRDLRTFAEAIQRAAGSRSNQTPIIASATTTSAAAEADRQRVAEAQAAAKVATQTAATVAAAVDADTLATVQQDAGAWAAAERSGTAAGYQSYLASYPTGAQASAARAAIVKLNSKPAAFSLDQISGEVKAAAEAARRAQASANARASSARDAATAATSATGLRSIVAANGDQYEAQISGGAPNGLGVRVAGNAGNAGDRYRGEMRDGQSSGLGVYEYASNPSNTGGAARYEGEHTRGGSTGYGVTYWKNGDNFAGQEVAANQSRGVFTFANGQKYEGELRDGTRNGFGVVWGPDGSLLAAGRWANGDLVEPMARDGKPAQ